MSQLQKAISRIGRREGVTLGFAQAPREQPKAMLLGLVIKSKDEAKPAFEAGADFIVVQASNAAAAASALDGADLGKAFAGAVVESVDEEGANALAEAGCDFVASTLAGTASTAVDTDRMGQVVRLDTTVSDTVLRSLAPIGLDAIFVESVGATTTLADQLELVRVASFASVPLLISVTANASMQEFRVLRDSGTAAVILPAGTSAKQIGEVVKALRSVPQSKRARREGNEMALVPAVGARHDEDEDDDDDHDH